MVDNVERLQPIRRRQTGILGKSEDLFNKVAALLIIFDDEYRMPLIGIRISPRIRLERIPRVGEDPSSAPV